MLVNDNIIQTEIVEKMEYKAKQGMVVYRAKHHATLKRNFQIMPIVSSVFMPAADDQFKDWQLGYLH